VFSAKAACRSRGSGEDRGPRHRQRGAAARPLRLVLGSDSSARSSRPWATASHKSGSSAAAADTDVDS